jgi:hypothetical protein
MESSVIIGDQHVNNANTSAAVVAAAQSFLVNQTAGILFFAVHQQDQSASANDMVLRTSTTINVVPAQQQHARCCKLTEGVYTIMGCISVTLFFLGVATIKFLG